MTYLEKTEAWKLIYEKLTTIQAHFTVTQLSDTINEKYVDGYDRSTGEFTWNLYDLLGEESAIFYGGLSFYWNNGSTYRDCLESSFSSYETFTAFQCSLFKYLPSCFLKFGS